MRLHSSLFRLEFSSIIFLCRINCSHSLLNERLEAQCSQRDQHKRLFALRITYRRQIQDREYDFTSNHTRNRDQKGALDPYSAYQPFYLI